MVRDGLKLPRRLCACGKINHETLEAAERQRVRHQARERQHRPSAPALRVYYCDLCRSWHVGHSS
jgi:hypothetical protein